MQSIDDTAVELNVLSKGKNTLGTVANNLRSINEIVNFFRMYVVSDNNSQNGITTNNDITFSGQHTDIAFVDCNKNSTLDQSVINNIQDEQLRQNVQQSYNEAVVDGYLRYENNAYSLTDKGRAHINTQSFIEQFEKDQLSRLAQDRALINLTGNHNDLNAFRYTESLNLNQIMTSDPQTFKKIVSYFEECKKYGFVNISKDGTVTPTEKCEKYLHQNPNKSIDVTKVNSQNIKDLYAKAQMEKTVSKVASATKTATTKSNVVGVVASVVVNLSQKGLQELKKSQNIHSPKLNHYN